MAEPKSLFEYVQDVAGASVAALFGYAIGKQYEAKDPKVVAALSAPLGALVTDVTKKLLAENKKNWDAATGRGEPPESVFSFRTIQNELKTQADRDAALQRFISKHNL
jgi:hypothetical protein